MTKDASRWLNEIVRERDRTEFSLGDTYDIKASIILVISTFLATLCGQILANPDLSIPLKWLQLFTVVSLIASGIFALLVLRPRDYDLEAQPNKIKDWLEVRSSELKKYYSGKTDVPNIEEVAFDDACHLQFDSASRRIAQHRAFNLDKSRWLGRAFMFVGVAFFLEVSTLLCFLPKV